MSDKQDPLAPARVEALEQWARIETEHVRAEGIAQHARTALALIAAARANERLLKAADAFLSAVEVAEDHINDSIAIATTHGFPYQGEPWREVRDDLAEAIYDVRHLALPEGDDHE